MCLSKRWPCSTYIAREVSLKSVILNAILIPIITNWSINPSDGMGPHKDRENVWPECELNPQPPDYITVADCLPFPETVKC